MADDDLRDVIYLNAPGFLGVDLPDQLFGVLDRALTRYKASRVKTIDDGFLLVLGLAHLREWIAPGYNHQTPARYPDQRFFNAIFELESFRLLLAVANGAKHHQNRKEIAVRSRHFDKIDDWPDFDAALSVDDGPVAEYIIEGEDLENLCQEVLEFYRKNWISLSDDERYGSLELRMRRVQEESQTP
jgi:hypothetical protein